MTIQSHFKISSNEQSLRSTVVEKAVLKQRCEETNPAENLLNENENGFVFCQISSQDRLTSQLQKQLCQHKEGSCSEKNK